MDWCYFRIMLTFNEQNRFVWKCHFQRENQSWDLIFPWSSALKICPRPALSLSLGHSRIIAFFLLGIHKGKKGKQSVLQCSYFYFPIKSFSLSYSNCLVQITQEEWVWRWIQGSTEVLCLPWTARFFFLHEITSSYSRLNFQTLMEELVFLLQWCYQSIKFVFCILS